MSAAANKAEIDRDSLSHNIANPAAIMGCTYKYELTNEDETQRKANMLGT